MSDDDSGQFTAHADDGASELPMSFGKQTPSNRKMNEELLKAIGYDAHLTETFDERQASQKRQNVAEFVAWIARRGEEDGKTLLELAQTIALLSRLDGDDGDTDAVRLTTVHASKGLEFPHVFVAGCEEGLMPHTGDAQDEDDEGPQRIEEERRLMYVAVTRAQRSLTISWCRQRRRARALVQRLPSRFREPCLKRRHRIARRSVEVEDVGMLWSGRHRGNHGLRSLRERRGARGSARLGGVPASIASR
jgi:superfamily I DNA/RNA helicase